MTTSYVFHQWIEASETSATVVSPFGSWFDGDVQGDPVGSLTMYGGAPTWDQGFAQHGGESLSPGLWDGLTGAWVPGLGPTGGALRDISPSKAHGTLVMDPANDWEMSDGRYSLDFDGVDDYVTTPNRPLDGLTQLSFSLWANVTVFGYNDAMISHRGTEFLYFGCGNAGSNTLMLYLWSAPLVTGSNVFTSGEWFHAAGTWDGASQTIYVNGVQVAQSARVHAASSLNDLINIGRDDGGAKFDGKLDDVLIHNRALNPNEISQLYQLGRGGIFRKKRRIAFKSTAVAAAALDQTRMSTVNLLMPFRTGLVNPADASFTQGNRQAAVYSYAGILAGAAGGVTTAPVLKRRNQVLLRM